MSDARFPRLFGKYVLLRPLARGGMGELYLAATGDLGGAEKLCVVKKLPEAEGLSPRDPSKVRRLLDEARVMVRLNQSNLVQVFDAGIVDGELYLAMELVAGRDLRAAWNRCADLSARIPVDMALYVVREVARGLAFAHSYGGLHLVHRDIAPPNILCSWQGEVKITDFGLAASRLKSEHTGPGVVFGRMGYLAPEQARGETADHRADIYSLGVILWELLTGRPLIDPTLEPAEALRRIATQTPEPPSSYAPDLPPSLDQVVGKALSPRREARYSIADEMRQAVGRELLRLSPDVDQGCVVAFLRKLYGDEIEGEQREHERMLREELPRARPPRGAAPTPAGGLPAAGGLTGVRAEIAARYAEPRPPSLGAPPPDVSGRLMQIVDGRYRIERLLGEGGMGAVYEAEHIAIRKKVALKVLHRPFSQQADLVARFRREAQAASRIGHPNIIDVTDFGYTPDGSAYLVMEHLEGLDLGDVLSRRGKLPPPRALRIAVQLVQALSAAHAAGVIHRDLKPENIFLIHPEEAEATAPWHMGSALRDIVKVLDFGIAMRLDPSGPVRLTDPGLTVGTPTYMAPEQAAGSKVDGRADIYAAGTILYEMLCGRVPFDDSAPLGELLMRKTREEAPPLPDPAVAPALARLVGRCLERDPARRPQSMAELLQDLLALQAGAEPPPSRAPSPFDETPLLPLSPVRGALSPSQAQGALGQGVAPAPSLAPPASAQAQATAPPPPPPPAAALPPSISRLLAPPSSPESAASRSSSLAAASAWSASSLALLARAEGAAAGPRDGEAPIPGEVRVDSLAALSPRAPAPALRGSGPQVRIGDERSAHPATSDPTVPFSTAEHGALVPRDPKDRRRIPREADLGLGLSSPGPASGAGPAAAAPPRRSRLGLLLGAGAAAALLALGFTAARYWPSEPAEPAGSAEPGAAARRPSPGAGASAGAEAPGIAPAASSADARTAAGAGVSGAGATSRPGEAPSARVAARPGAGDNPSGSAAARPGAGQAPSAGAPPRPGAGEGRPEVALLEWARRATEGGRLVSPPGDNLRELLARIEAVSPGNPEAQQLREAAAATLVGQAREQLRRKDGEAALRSYRALSALRAEAPFPRSDLAQLLSQQARSLARKSRPRALEAAAGAVEVDPHSVSGRLLLGELYLQSGQRALAAAEFKRALGMHPDAAGERAARQGLAKAGGARRRKR